ncbi:MAG: hypothetical protein O2807_02625, partial [bacterium]|nr:hypothetical protein [bacterium]
VTTIGWTVAVALLPAIVSPDRIGVPWGVAVLLVFFFSLFRSGMVELRDMQGDRILGKRTLASALGKEKTLVLLTAVTGGEGVLLLVCVLAGVLAPTLGLAMMLPVAYGGGCLYLYVQKFIGHSGMTEAVLDFQFILAGALAYLLA